MGGPVPCGSRLDPRPLLTPVGPSRWVGYGDPIHHFVSALVWEVTLCLSSVVWPLAMGVASQIDPRSSSLLLCVEMGEGGVGRKRRGPQMSLRRVAMTRDRRKGA